MFPEQPNKIYSVYIGPENKRWRLKLPETNPKATRVEKASIYIIENLQYPEAFQPKLPKKRMDTL